MDYKETTKSVSKIYAIGIPINIILELTIHFLALISPALIIIKVSHTNDFLILAFGLLSAFYIYTILLLVFGGLTIRWLPKPRLGYLTPIDHLKFQVLSAFSKFIRRTPARWAMIFPFPASIYYRLANSKIHPSAFQSTSDSIPDLYLTSIGKNTLLGWDVAILGHISSDSKTIYLGKVAIGNDVLIGGQAVIMPNVKIGDGSVIQNKSLVLPGTIIPPYEVWGGNPAKKIRDISHKKVQYLSKKEIVNQLYQLLNSYHDFNYAQANLPLSSLGFNIEQINYILVKLEKWSGVFIDRTDIDINDISYQDLSNVVLN